MINNTKVKKKLSTFLDNSRLHRGPSFIISPPLSFHLSFLELPFLPFVHHSCHSCFQKKKQNGLEIHAKLTNK